MIDFGFVIGAFVPLVLYWMSVLSCHLQPMFNNTLPDLGITTSVPSGASHLDLV